jgi:DNA polymerase I-like protein with 3'-5' exonuclease and polymerase domains
MYNLYNKPTREHSIIVDTVSKLKKLAEKLKHIQEFAFDTETNTLQVAGENKEFICVGISISWGRFNNYYIPMGHRRVEDYKRNLGVSVVKEYLQPIFNREDVRIIGHNLKYDMHVLKRLDISIATKDFFDTMLASWLLDENTPNGLKQITQDNLNVPQTHFVEVINNIPSEIKKEFGFKANSKATFDLTLIDESAFYALDDPFYTYYNYMYLLDELEKDGMDKIYFKKMIPFMIVLFNMEERGITVDLDELHRMRKEITDDMDDLLYHMTEILGVEFNPNSNQQLQAILFGYVKDIKKPDEVNPKKGLSPIQEIREKYEGKKNWTEEKIQKKIADLWAKYDETIGEWRVYVENGFDFKPTSTTSAGAPSTDSGSLWTLSHKEYKVKRKREGVEFCSLLLEYKRLAKLKSAFIEGLEEQLYDDGKAHCSFNQIGTTSGRISCIEENQLVQVYSQGEVPIKNVEVGDLVYCKLRKNPHTNAIRKVLRVIDNGYRECIKLTYINPLKIIKSLICTLDHKIMTEKGTWVEAFDLEVGDRLTNDFTLMGIDIVGVKHVYDLEVEDFHNFIVEGICVHNCSSPNLQQLPKAHGDEDNYAIRKLFIGSIDHVTKKRKKIIAVDYSNLEIRCTAHLSGDPLLLDMFAHGKDIHGTTAINMFELNDCDDKTVKQKHPDLRQAAKVLNFLLIYGGSASALYDSLKYDRSAPIDLGDKEHLAKYKKFGVKNGVDVAQVYIDKYFDSYKGVAQMIRENKKFARKHGFVYTIIKRKRRLEGINSSDNKIRSYCERLATNARVQGTASDIVSSAQVRLENDPWFEEHRCLMLVQVHDEVVYECPEEYVEEAEERIKAIMAKPFGENVSLKVELKADSDSGSSYNEAK